VYQLYTDYGAWCFWLELYHFDCCLVKSIIVGYVVAGH